MQDSRAPHGEASRAIIVVGHGAPPSDVPRDLVMRLKALEGRRRASGTPMDDEERELDSKLREWPRTAATDPYAAGVENLVEAVRRASPGVRVAVAFNEFCTPSLEQAVQLLYADGVREIDVVPTMFTQGGVHSEIEIPETLEALRREHAELVLHYAWPFDADAIASLLLATIARRAKAS